MTKKELVNAIAAEAGLSIIFNDPVGGASNEKHLIRFAHSDFYFHSSSLRQAWLGCLKTKIPLARDVFHLAEKEGFEPPDPWNCKSMCYIMQVF